MSNNVDETLYMSSGGHRSSFGGRGNLSGGREKSFRGIGNSLGLSGNMLGGVGTHFEVVGTREKHGELAPLSG